MPADHLMTDTHDALLAIQAITRIAQHEHDGRDDAERAVRRAEFAIAEANEAVETATAKLKDADARLATQAESLAACMARLTTAEQALADERRAHAAAPDAIETIHARRAYELVERSTPWDGLPADARVEWAMSVRYLLDHMDIGPNGCLVASTAKRGHFADIVSERDTALARVKELEVRDADWQRVTGAAHPAAVRVLTVEMMTEALVSSCESSTNIDGSTSKRCVAMAAGIFAALSTPTPPILPAQGAAASDEEIAVALFDALPEAGAGPWENLHSRTRCAWIAAVAKVRPLLTAREGAGVVERALYRAHDRGDGLDADLRSAVALLGRLRDAGRHIGLSLAPSDVAECERLTAHVATLRPTPATPPAVDIDDRYRAWIAANPTCPLTVAEANGLVLHVSTPHSRIVSIGDPDRAALAAVLSPLTADVVEAAEKWHAVYVDARAAGRPESVRRQVLSEAVRALSAHRGKPAPASVAPAKPSSTSARLMIEAAKMLRWIADNGGRLATGGEEWPNAECAYDIARGLDIYVGGTEPSKPATDEQPAARFAYVAPDEARRLPAATRRAQFSSDVLAKAAAADLNAGIGRPISWATGPTDWPCVVDTLAPSTPGPAEKAGEVTVDAETLIRDYVDAFADEDGGRSGPPPNKWNDVDGARRQHAIGVMSKVCAKHAGKVVTP